MGRRDAARRRAGGGEHIQAPRRLRNTLSLAAGSVGLASGVTAWLALAASDGVARPVAGIAAAGVATLALTLAIGRPEGIAPALALLGAAYALLLAIDEPPLDGRAAVLGAALLAIGELAHLSLDARIAMTPEAGAVARRVGSVALFALVALGLGALLLVLVDLVRTGGIAIEALAVAATIAAVALLARAARDGASGT